MPKCNRCGKKGLFLKVNSSGVCKECSRIIKLEKQRDELISNIEELENKLSDKQGLYEQLLLETRGEAQKQAEADLEQVTWRYDYYSKLLKEKEEAHSKALSKLIKAEKNLESTTSKASKLRRTYESVLYSIDRFRDSTALDDGRISAIAEDAAQLFEPTIKIPLHCMDIKTLRQQYRQNEKLINSTLEAYQGRYTTKANIAIYQLMVIALQAELQNILYSIRFGKLENAIAAVKEITAKYQKIATEGNQNIASTVTKFIGEIEYLFIEAVKIEYEYFVQKERIREEQQAIREQMRQEAEERKILEQQKKQVEKEENKFKVEIASITEQMSSAEDDEKVRLLQERIDQLNEQLKSVSEKKEEIVRLQNGKAGYVYVISNLGAFGDKMFKIGMTRRQDPIERVNELGDASVPFPFDVHSFIFSDNAVDLENQLHKTLHNQRVNKINLRKEFFYSTIDELEKLVESIDPSAEFKRTMLAEQYHQSLSVDDIPDSVAMDIEEDEAI